MFRAAKTVIALSWTVIVALTGAMFVISLSATACRAAPQFRLMDVGSFTPGGLDTQANGINNNGQVTGFSYIGGSGGSAFRTEANQPINPATDQLGSIGGMESSGIKINASGQVAGSMQVGPYLSANETILALTRRPALRRPSVRLEHWEGVGRLVTTSTTWARLLAMAIFPAPRRCERFARRRISQLTLRRIS